LILGDVLEHLSIEDAQNLLSDLTLKNIYCMVAVPYQMEQEAVGGNIYEIHKQSDLTIYNFTDRYPLMKPFKMNGFYGLYLNYNFI
jgi:hypothetical protein